MNFFLDANGNPVTQQVQSNVVTDASGNPVTGMQHMIFLLFQISWSMIETATKKVLNIVLFRF